MSPLKEKIGEYLKWCESVRGLNAKTLRAYRGDLAQFDQWLDANNCTYQETSIIKYLEYMNKLYAPGSVKRKVASIRSFSAFLYAKNRVADPFFSIDVRIKTPKRLPRTIPQSDLALLVGDSLVDRNKGTDYLAIRDYVLVELLLATGIRISELCTLNEDDYDCIGRNLNTTRGYEAPFDA